MPVEKTIKRGMSLFLFAVLQSFITCPGCSVKEDRDQCPCILRIVYAEDDGGMLAEGIGICLDGTADGDGLGDGHWPDEGPDAGHGAVDSQDLDGERSLAGARNLAGARSLAGIRSLAGARSSWAGSFGAGSFGAQSSGAQSLGVQSMAGTRSLAEERSFGGGRRHLDTAVTIISGLEVSLRAWRGDLDVLTLYPVDAERMEEDGECWFRIREGSSCPEIWTAHSRVNTGSDRAVVQCNLRKSHCRIRIIFNGTGSYVIRARGNVCGYGYDGQPYPGSFMADAQADEDGSLYVCVPRQYDNSLMLDLISGDGGVRSFAIGNYLAESGYDWGSDDLHDATITIDYAATSVTFTIDKWSRTLQFETVI